MSSNSEFQTHARDRLLAAVDLADFGIDLMRQNIRRALPDAHESVIERELRRWLIEQPKDFRPTSE